MGNDALYVPVRLARYAKTLNVLNELDKFGELGGAIYDEAANLSEPNHLAFKCGRGHGAQERPLRAPCPHRAYRVCRLRRLIASRPDDMAVWATVAGMAPYDFRRDLLNRAALCFDLFCGMLSAWESGGDGDREGARRRVLRARAARPDRLAGVTAARTVGPASRLPAPHRLPCRRGRAPRLRGRADVLF